MHASASVPPLSPALLSAPASPVVDASFASSEAASSSDDPSLAVNVRSGTDSHAAIAAQAAHERRAVAKHTEIVSREIIVKTRLSP